MRWRRRGSPILRWSLGERETARVVEVIEDVLVAPEDPEAVLARMADPGVRIVSLTVTEKGYCHSPATGRLAMDHPDIVHDLGAALPRSAPGFLVRALQRRRAAGVRPFTVMSCDNLPANGRLVRGVVLDLARAVDPGLADWIAAEGRFPSTMVDRITPAVTEADIARVERLTGRRDAAPVLHEPFRQWVVEDDFVDGARPDLGAVGVELVGDVTPFEHMKLRMLNGTHSALAYLGYLAGHETIAETVADPVFAAFVRRLWAREIIPAVEAPPGVDLGAYAEALMARYRNPAIRHRTWQIAMDGSQKLPQRILGTMAEGLEAGRACRGSRSWWRGGCATWGAWTSAGSRSTCAIRWRRGCGRSPRGRTRWRGCLACGRCFRRRSRRGWRGRWRRPMVGLPRWGRGVRWRSLGAGHDRKLAVVRTLRQDHAARDRADRGHGDRDRAARGALRRGLAARGDRGAEGGDRGRGVRLGRGREPADPRADQAGRGTSRRSSPTTGSRWRTSRRRACSPSATTSCRCWTGRGRTLPHPWRAGAPACGSRRTGWRRSRSTCSGGEAAEDDYLPEVRAKAAAWFQKATEAEREALLHSIMSGLPGAFDRYDIAGLRKALKGYEGIGRDAIRANYRRFLEEVVPAAEELGMRLCVHPDDPPRDILGLPRIVVGRGGYRLGDGRACRRGRTG